MPQYEGVAALYRQYYAQGFAVLGFPCNQFGLHELGDTAEIARFCPRTYNVTFPIGVAARFAPAAASKDSKRKSRSCFERAARRMRWRLRYQIGE